MSRYMIHDIGLNFINFYKTIAKDNFSSIAVAEKCGFYKAGEAIKKGKLHKIVPVEEGDCFLYKYSVK